MKKLFLTCLLAIASLHSAVAEDGKGILTLYGLQDYTVVAISPNGKWAAGFFLNGLASTYAFRWNLETDECRLLSGNADVSLAWGVSNDGTVVGNFNDYTRTSNGAPVKAVGYYKDGSWNTLEPIVGFNTPDASYDGYAMCISDDGHWIGGANYDANGKWMPVVWKDGKLYKVLGTMSGTVETISNDGKKAAGWAYKPGDSDVRYSVIWDIETGEATYLSDSGSPFNKGIKFTSDGKYMLHSSRLDGGFHGYLYNVLTGENTMLPYYGGSDMPWNIEYYTMDDDLNVFGIETNGQQTSTFGTVTTNGEVTLLTDYLAAKGFDVSDTEWPISYLLNATAVSNDGKTMAVVSVNTDMYEHPLIIRFDQNVTTREPVCLEASQAVGLMGAKLTWKAPIGSPTGLTGYNVYRNGTKITEQPVTSTLYVDNNIAAGDYTYTVTAVYGTAESAQSEASTVTVVERQLSAPRAFMARQKGYNSVSLTWNAPATNLVDMGYYNPEADLIGFGGDDQSFEFAVKYSKAELDAYEGYAISKVAFIPRSEQLSWKIKIYDGTTCIYEQPIEQELTYGVENIVALTTPVAISSLTNDVTCAIAVSVDPTIGSNNVVGMEEGNCVAGFSDLVHLEGETEFYSLSERSRDNGYSFDIAFAMSIVLSNSGESADIDKIESYTITDGNGLSAVVAPADGNCYVHQNVADGEHTYSISALYSGGRQSPKVETSITVAANEDVYAPISDIKYSGDGSSVTFNWSAPIDDDAQNITYSGDTYGETILGSESSNWGYIARSIYTSKMFKGLRGYSISKVRFYPVGSAYFTIYVYDDGKLVSYKEVDDSEYALGQWNTITLDTPVPVDENSEYTLDIECFDGLANTGPLAVDNLPFFDGYSQLASTDGGESFSSLLGGTTGNWMMGLVAVAPDAAPLPVDGYNVRIDAKQVNENLLSATSYTHDFGADASLSSTHRVNVDVTYTGHGTVNGSSVFFKLEDVANGIDNVLTADFRVYPNPATDYVVVDGEGVEEISAYSMGGALVGRTAGNRLDVSSYAPGLYIVKVKAAGKEHTVKLNVIR